ncbi:ChrR family anti-sigma-E factor [Oricola sp.]|uniref:ChrR family anti-sigma-E factor n=1 Tax=Oricola sp. TaxID=1979950 RepID=UPI0025DF9F48|nr:ChrR family anti-sigma-E factor [Oricola sp.]MCI5073820.1 ChrR family anti-sigma-E factor [Oricola sp.]
MSDSRFENMDALMAGFVAGTLPRPVAVMVAAHLELSAGSRALVRAMEASAGDLLEAETPVPLTSRDARLEAIFASKDEISGMTTRPREPGAVLPHALHDFVGHTIETIPWKTKLPGYREYDLGEADGCHATLMWIKPGRTMPAHTHEGAELTLVLDGAFTDVNGRFGRGDISFADESLDHRPVAEKGRACIAFAVTDAPLRLTGPLYQRISDILGTT